MFDTMKYGYSSIKILIAEDSPTQMEAIRFFMEDQGFTTLIARNGREALEIAGQNVPDLVVSDVMMPEMTGFELCRAIRKDPKLRHLPVILVTSLASPTDVFLGLESGADNFITKPYDEKYLLSRIDYILANRELRKSGKLQVGIEIELAGERHFITAERQQILDLLVSTYEQAVRLNEEVQHGQQLLNRSYDTLNALYRIAEGLNSCQTEEDVCGHVLHWGLQLPGIQAGWILRLRQDGGLDAMDAQGLAEDALSDAEAQSILGYQQRLLEGTMIVAEDVSGNDPLTGLDGEKLTRHAAVPLIIDGGAIGLLNLAGSGDGGFTESELQTMSTIGQQIAIALERIRLHRDLEAKVESRTSELRHEIVERQSAESAARIAESRLRDAINSIDEGFTLFDQDDRLILLNDRARAMFPGVDNGHDIGRTFEEIVRGAVQRDLYPQARGREAEFLADRLNSYRRADGQPIELEIPGGRWVMLNERHTSDGGVVAVRTDISALKESQGALAMKARRQAALADLGQRALGRLPLAELLSLASSVLQDVLEVPFTRVFEVGGEDLTTVVLRAGHGWRAGSVGQKVRLPGQNSQAAETLRAGRPVVVADWSREVRFAQTEFLREHGIVCGATVPIPGAAGWYGVLGIDSDEPWIFAEDDLNFLQSMANVIGAAVQRQQHEEGLRQANELISGILDSSPTAIITLDADGKVVPWNAASEAIFGYTTEEILGQPYPLIPSGGEADFSELFNALIQGEPLKNVEVQRRRRDDVILHTRLSGEPLYDHLGKFRGVTFSHEDVTERRKVEAQLRQAQKMEAIGNLTGGIAHDFNNLLAVVIGNLDLLKPTLEGQTDALDMANTALKASLRGADLTRQLLAFSRRQELTPRLTDVNNLIKGMVKLLDRTLSGNVAIKLDLRDNIGVLMIDPSQLDSALVNLSVNARDAMPGGGMLMFATRAASAEEITWERDIKTEAENYVVIEVSDSGSGIPPEVLDHIFEPFFTTKEAGKGTGLGLAMVYGFLKQSGGHISVYSEVGHGTTFRLYLPCAGEAALESERTKQEATITQSADGESILVVEDNPAVRKVVVRQLINLGYTVTEASSGAEAIRHLERMPGFDLVFSDIVMAGGISGQNLAERIAERWPTIKVLLTSGYPEMVVKSRQDISAEILSKPYRQVDLARKIREVLES